MVTLAPALTDDENIKTILEKRYLKKNDAGEIVENPKQMFYRVASTVAGAERNKTLRKHWTAKFEEIMVENKFLPNSPTLMNAGISGTLSACFVIGVEDTMESILYAVQKAGMVMKFGGGVGYYLGKVRSKGVSISSTHGNACGPISVLEQLNQTSKLITQGGKRDGANMAILPISHPDIRAFIHCKDANIGAEEHNQVIDQFNISVSVPNDFFVALKENLNWDLIDPHTKEITDTVDANELWNEIHESAWTTGDPGIFLHDQVNAQNTTPNLGPLYTTNPCGEVPLYDEEACNLGSINLSTFVKNGSIDLEDLKTTTQTAIRFLDNVVTVNEFPIPEIREAVNKTRKLGLGVSGWHHTLIKLGIPYESNEAIELAEQLMGWIHNTARATSRDLAGEKGLFPAWKGSIFEHMELAQRNATCTCIAPTGTLARLQKTSFGIEPVFAWVQESKIMRNQISGSLIDHDPIVPFYFKENFNGSHQSMLKEFEDHFLKYGTVQNAKFLSEKEKALFKTANEISYQWHIKHQAAFQAFTDLAVSKTINMANDATIEDVKNAYEMARTLGCKGLTIYRDGSRSFQVLDSIKVENITEVELDVSGIEDAPTVTLIDNGLTPNPLAWKAESVRYKIPTPIGPDCLVYISKDTNDIVREIVVVIGKGGADVQTTAEAIGRSVTLGLKYGVPLEEFHAQLSGITSGRYSIFQGAEIKSLPDAVAFAIGDYINDPDVLNIGLSEEITTNYHYCPDCSNTLTMAEGCLSCTNPQCSYSKC